MTHVHKEWSPDLAAKTEQILRSAEKAKSAGMRFVDSSLYWILLIIAILGNFILSVVLVPFLITMRGLPLYFSLFFIGGSFGWMFSFILHHIEQLKKGQHIIASIFIPALAIINVGIFAMLSNKLIFLMKLSTPPHNPFLVGAVYVFGYVLPGSIIHFGKK
ncbi:MAG: hypothetical protein QW165_02860 [Candidatus Woesearchaeota archaeon]